MRAKTQAKTREKRRKIEAKTQGKTEAHAKRLGSAVFYWARYQAQMSKSASLPRRASSLQRRSQKRRFADDRAFGGAFPAGFCAGFAMRHVGVLFTFIGAGGADFGTEGTDFFGKTIAAGHRVDGKRTDGRTVPVELDAPGEHGRVAFFHASAHAVQARIGAGLKGLDGTLKIMIFHL